MQFNTTTRDFPTRTYVDTPATVRMVGGGLLETEKECNVLVSWATTSLQNPRNSSTLAVRWAYNGQRHFECDDGRFAIDDSCYLIFNEGRAFSSTIDSPIPVECHTVCFHLPVSQKIRRDLTTPAEKLLDDPNGWGKSVEFFERTYPHDETVTPILHRLQRLRDSAIATHLWFEEQFHELMAGLLQVHSGVLQEMEQVPAARAATRAELYLRMHRARDFMEASLHQPISLNEIAEVAWFSPHHFLRLFKKMFGETPHQYLTRRRIETARQMLTRTDQSVTEICGALGFESLGSFSWLFRRHMGASPEQFRLSQRNALFQINLLEAQSLSRQP
jgi:AraC family transcriptional regulator